MKSKFSAMPRAIALTFLLLCLGNAAFAQEKAEEPPAKRKGSIKGKVMSDDGQPIEGASVNFNVMGGNGAGGGRQMLTDEEGNFRADELAPGLYSVTASSLAHVEPERALEPKYNRLGDTLTFTLVKGGVITGRVTNAVGEPVIAAPIRVERVSDLEGRKISSEWWYGQQRKTDDRGVYRVFGLPSGRYVVSIGGKSPYRYGAPTTYEMETPTFYPSSTRDGATEISVNVGEEVRGIDIRYRSEKGYSISGNVTGLPSDSVSLSSGMQIVLRRYPGDGIEMSTYLQIANLTSGFEFFTVPDGEYELEASLYGDENKGSYKSARRRVSVKGANIANIELRLLLLSTIEAKIEWADTPEKDRQASCQSARPPLPEETMFWLVKDEPKATNQMSQEPTARNALPNEKNDLKYTSLDAATYRFAPRLLDGAWYLKALTAKTDDAKPSDPKSKIQNPKPPVDLAKQGIAVKVGERRKDIVLTLGNGAVQIAGRVVASTDQSLPSRLRVYVVPAEKEAADDLLRYAELKTKDGTFTFPNLAPGKYWLLARNVAEVEPDALRPNPLAWDAVMRKSLRAEAEAANQLVEVKPCQRLNDFVLRLPAAR